MTWGLGSEWMMIMITPVTLACGSGRRWQYRWL
jgi:hypothetical protein